MTRPLYLAFITLLATASCHAQNGTAENKLQRPIAALPLAEPPAGPAAVGFEPSLLLHLVESTPEQAAFDYFLLNILERDFPEHRAIGFENVSQRDGWSAFAINCEGFNRERVEAMIKATPGPVVAVSPEKCPIEVRKFRRSSRQLQIDIFSRIDIDGRFYVYIRAFQKLQFVEHYLITLSQQDLSIIDVCKFSEVI